MEQAFASIENHDLPSVAWRLHATAAQLQMQIAGFRRKRTSLPSRQRPVSSRAAASFGENDPLRRSLINAAAP